MKKDKRFLTIFFTVLALPFFGKAQTGNTMPGLFDTFFKNYYLVNPAGGGDGNHQYRVQVGNKMLTGLFQGVGQIYFDGDLRIKSTGKGTRQYLGLQAVSDREGDFFSRSRMYARYSWHTNISARASLAAGASLGFVNYAFKSSQASAGGSATALDGNWGVWFTRDAFNAGFSMQQMFRQELRPIRYVFLLNRYYNLTASYLFRLNHELNMTVHMYSRMQRAHAANLEIAPVFELQRRVEAGVNYRYNRGFAFIAGIKRIKIGNSGLTLLASYFMPSGKTASVNDNAIEFYIAFEK